VSFPSSKMGLVTKEPRSAMSRGLERQIGVAVSFAGLFDFRPSMGPTPVGTTPAGRVSVRSPNDSEHENGKISKFRETFKGVAVEGG
jgi:hypothetical protein